MGNYYKTTEVEGLKDLLTYHGFSIRITGRSGIRFKTGIATQVREALLGEGINGYTLKEYGTLVMSNANLGTYPMIKGGEKVSNAMAYGKNEDGTLTDNIFAIVKDRYHYTAVLVDIPAEYYKAEFAFRGYATLTKGEEEITLYGPIRYRSIYSLAEQALSLNMYEEGSDAWSFLKQLITDGDNPPQLTTQTGVTGEEAEE